jgi:predicted peptidase
MLWAQTPSTIQYGCAIDAQEQIHESPALAKSIASPEDPQWQAKGDLHRKYHSPAANADMPYRLYVPISWDGKSRLPLIVVLHGPGADENWYLDANDKQLIRLAEQHVYIFLSPLGYTRMGAYGTPLRFPAVFGNREAAAQQRASVDAERERTLGLSEKEVINVLEIVLNEHPVDRSSVFLTGHSMGSGGTWYLNRQMGNSFSPTHAVLRAALNLQEKLHVKETISTSHGGFFAPHLLRKYRPTLRVLKLLT